MAVAGLNAWFAAAGLPWLFMEAPTTTHTVLHWGPLGLLTVGLVSLLFRNAPIARRERVLTLLMAGFPVLLALAVAHRGEPNEDMTLPGFGLLWCVVALWGFVAAAASLSLDGPDAMTSPRALGFEDLRRSGRVVAVMSGTLLVLTVAPRWLDLGTRLKAWGPAADAGALLTVAAATAIAISTVLIMLGPSAIGARGTPRPLRVGVVLQSLLLAALGAATYWLTLR